MTEPIKISDEDMNKIREIQIQYQKKIEEFGNLYIEKMSIDEGIKLLAQKESQIHTEFKNLQKRENDFIEELLKKYGEGNLDLKQGTFTPTK